jgi:imidazolonepropionase-like amidohydrolase
MDREARTGPHVIEIEGSRVCGIFPAGEFSEDGPAEHIDWSHLTALPGLIDAHTHLGLDVMAGNEGVQAQVSDTAMVLRAASHGAKNLRHGVTALRLVGERNFLDVPLREMFNSSALPGPKVVTATRGIRPSSGHGALAAVADGVDQMTKVTRENLRNGADLIKLFVTGGVATPGTEPEVSCFSREEVAAAVAVAHQAGKPVCAHAYGGPGVDYCLDEGVDHIEHGIYMSPEQFSRIAELDRWLVGTIGVFLTKPGPAEDPSWPVATREKFLRAREASAESITKAKAAGVKLALGTDAIHGGVAEEAIFAAGLGLTNQEALAAITSSAAELCGLDSTIGSIQVGKTADLIAVEGNPLEDLRVLRSVIAVIKDGQVVE